jgi:uncharacterized membrane protein HdeD (DUF308 family)
MHLDKVEMMSVYGLARNWWLMILRGFWAVGLSLTILVWPKLTLGAPTAGALFSVYVLGEGVLAVLAGLTRYNGSRRWWLLLIEGGLGIGVGALTLLAPSLPALLYLLAAWALLTGLVEIVSAIRLRSDIENEGLLALSGVFSLALGAVLVIWPQATGPALVWLLGSYALAYGLLLVGLGLRLWNWRGSKRLMTLQPVPVEVGHFPYPHQPEKK